MTRRLPDLKRRPPGREPKWRFTLYCEGSRTEPAYFRALERHCGSALLKVESIPGAGVAYSVAEAAVKARRARPSGDSFAKHDQVWAVFDRDDHPRFEDAIRLCETGKVGVAYSVPCFEVWLILHYQDYHRPDGRQEVQRFYGSLDQKYDGNGAKTPDCAVLMTRIDEAEGRAEKQLAARVSEGTPFGAPSTTVFRLTQAIRDAARKSGAKP